MKRNPLNPVSRTSPQLDWITTVVPFITILLLCILFFAVPEASGRVVASIRYFLGDEFGSCYLLMGLGIFLCSLYIAFSPYGAICLGADKKPQYSSFQWGSMMFTAGLAADILFYSLCEWILYAGEPRISQMGEMQDWASTYPPVSLGAYPLEFLHGAGRGIRLYAPCTAKGEAEILRGLPSSPWLSGGRFCGKTY